MSTFCSLCFIFLVGFVVSFSVGLSLVFIFFIESLLEFYGVHWVESVG